MLETQRRQAKKPDLTLGKCEYSDNWPKIRPNVSVAENGKHGETARFNIGRLRKVYGTDRCRIFPNCRRIF